MENSTESEKIMSQAEQAQLIKITKKMAENDLMRGRVKWVKRWMVVDLALHAGLTVAEIANLRVGDVKLAENSIFVRKGKFSKPGNVDIDNELAKHLASYLKWKKLRGEPIDHDAHFLAHLNTDRNYSISGVQSLFKESLRQAGLSERYTISSCRHTFAANIFEVTKDLTLLQKQLRHSSIAVTSDYVDTVLSKVRQATETENGGVEICPTCHQIVTR